MNKICPKCGAIAYFDAYYNRVVCTQCPWESEILPRGMFKKNVADTIDEIIKTHTITTPPTKEEAKEILRSCGILDKNYKIRPAYRDILIEQEPDEI